MSLFAFQYFEVRPVIRGADEDCVSFTDEAEFEREASRRRAAGEEVETFWTLYGIDAEGLSYAVSDYTAKESTFEILHAILAPMAEARDILDAGSVENTKADVLKDRAIRAANLLEDFILQCSNAERI